LCSQRGAERGTALNAAALLQMSFADEVKLAKLAELNLDRVVAEWKYAPPMRSQQPLSPGYH
jgi:hypothetical protein